MEILKTLRWPLVVAGALVTLGVFYAGNYLMRTTTEDGPLGKFLSTQPAVESYRLEQDAEGRQVVATLKDVPDLGQAYRDLDRGMHLTLGHTQYRLAVADRRSPVLTEAFYRINPLVQEALATGHYADLVDEAEARAPILGIGRVRIGIDSERVYVQLHTGSDYLYEVLPRPDGVRAVPGNQSGGVQQLS